MTTDETWTASRHALSDDPVDAPPETNGSAVDEYPDRRADWVAPFLHALFAAFEDARLRWLVPRNHQDLPHHVGHDVDIVVHPDDAHKVDLLLRQAIRRQRLILLRDYLGLEHHTFDVAAADLRGRLVLHVDIQTGLRYRGRLLVDADDLLQYRRREGALWVPEPAMEAYVLLLHAALHKRELKPKYAHRLADLRKADPKGFTDIVNHRLGQKLAEKAATVENTSELLALRRSMERAIDHRYRRNVVQRRWFTVHSALRQARLRLRPHGIFVVFLGPDGSGKSSTTDLLVGMLGAHGDVLPIHRVYLGSGQPVLPTRRLVRSLRGKTGPRAAAKPRAIRDVAPRRLRGALHVMIDTMVRYWIQARPRLSPHGIVLADRYAYDIFRINNPTVRKPWFRRLVLGIVPVPDITFFLEGDPSTVAARKQELTVDETMRQQAAYRDLEGLVPSFTAIDLTRRDEGALRNIALQILRAYARRNGGFVP